MANNGRSFARSSSLQGRKRFDCIKPPPIDQTPGASIFTVGSPPRGLHYQDSTQVHIGHGAFLEACFYCKKKFDYEEVVIFMYGILRAFCSERCRATHIALVEGKEEEKALL